MRWAMGVGEDLQEEGRGGHSQAGQWGGAFSGDPGCWGRTCAGEGGAGQCSVEVDQGGNSGHALGWDTADRRLDSCGSVL